jgi:metallo-beta-lactamase family protein
VLFGGDLGRYARPVLPDPDPPIEADVLLLESTYGNRAHAADDRGGRLARIINETASKGGKIIIPAFAVGRVEEVLYWINRLEEERTIPILPVYVDSPMASAALAVYEKHAHELEPRRDEPVGPEERVAGWRSVCAFCTANLKVVSSIPESRAVQDSREPAIIVSSSGMATGGRVLHHLERVLPEARHTVLFSGYQAAGTRGRLLLEGAKTTRIHGREVSVAARIESVDSLSAHADANEIMRWLGGFSTPPRLTCLVHGEPEPMDALKARIERELGWTVRTPLHQERIEI